MKDLTGHFFFGIDCISDNWDSDVLSLLYSKVIWGFRFFKMAFYKIIENCYLVKFFSDSYERPERKSYQKWRVVKNSSLVCAFVLYWLAYFLFNPPKK